MLENFFQSGPTPIDAMSGDYDFQLVILSYLVAVAASYLALDITGRLRDVGNTAWHTAFWLLGGAFAMGAGIWSMHFIGMLAFIMPIPMNYDLGLTTLSLTVAVLASGFALFLLKTKTLKIIHFLLGGIILGGGIVSMHYIGMAAMAFDMTIRYLPSLFGLSIVIAIFASEAAIWLALKSNQGTLKTKLRLKAISAIVMGIAICGMHYTGMAAAVFTTGNIPHKVNALDPHTLSTAVAGVTFFILGIAFIISTYKEFMNYQTVKLARQTGMAAVASNVLHNIGNILNNITTSASLIEEHIKKSKLTDLNKISELLTLHQHDLSHFMTLDPRGSQLPIYLKTLAIYWQKEQDLLTKELALLTQQIQYIKDIIATQQKFSGPTNFEEIVSITTVLHEALTVVNIDYTHHKIKIKKNYAPLKPVRIDRIKLLQILINLIRNAKDSLKEAENKNKLLSINLHLKNKDNFLIQIKDNGIGIPAENLEKIFLHGFTTKKLGHGFGLHASALSAEEMGGTLQVNSAGLGQGATFNLELPYKLQKI